MWVHHCSGIWDLLAVVTPVSQASCRALSFKCWVVVEFFTVLKWVQWDETLCRNTSSPCKARWAGLCTVHRKRTKSSLESLLFI